ncbi:hypothetical protein LRE75_34540 [Streptomyces sp. 372A]
MLAAHRDEAVVTAIGVHLPLLHRHACRFTAAYPELYDLAPGRVTPTAEWLRWGGHDRGRGGGA